MHSTTHAKHVVSRYEMARLRTRVRVITYNVRHEGKKAKLEFLLISADTNMWKSTNNFVLFGRSASFSLITLSPMAAWVPFIAILHIYHWSYFAKANLE